MRIQWYGQSAYALTGDGGRALVFAIMEHLQRTAAPVITEVDADETAPGTA